MLTVIDHTENRWAYRHRQINRENGASTYSKEIVEYHLPLWEMYSEGRDITISTCPKMTGMDGIGGGIAVQYLHEYRYDKPMRAPIVIHHELKMKFERIVFITAYKSFAAQINAMGFEAWHIPMAIDTSKVVPANRLPMRGPRTAAYFGNVIGEKVALYKQLVKVFNENGWDLEHVTGPQYGAWQDLTQFEYGVGVGRCALEMMQIGLKIMIAGSRFGGLITSDAEWEVQKDTNFNGRVTTFDSDIVTCLNAFDSSLRGRVVDVSDAVKILEGYLSVL